MADCYYVVASCKALDFRSVVRVILLTVTQYLNQNHVIIKKKHRKLDCC